MVDFTRSNTKHELKIAVNWENKVEIQEDLSKWAKKFLNGREIRMEIGGTVKLRPNEPESDSSEEEIDISPVRKGIK